MFYLLFISNNDFPIRFINKFISISIETRVVDLLPATTWNNTAQDLALQPSISVPNWIS